MKSGENFHMIETLADRLGGAVGNLLTYLAFNIHDIVSCREATGSRDDWMTISFFEHA
jgi:hypothetical protein